MGCGRERREFACVVRVSLVGGVLFMVGVLVGIEVVFTLWEYMVKPLFLR